MLHSKVEFSYFSIQLYEYLIHNHPHRANDFDFIKLRGDEAAIEFEGLLLDNYMQDEAIAYVSDRLYRGLHFSLHCLIKDILWSELSNEISPDRADSLAQKLYPKLKHLYTPADTNDEDYGDFQEIELMEVDQIALREKVIDAIRKILTEEYGI